MKNIDKEFVLSRQQTLENQLPKQKPSSRKEIMLATHDCEVAETETIVNVAPTCCNTFDDALDTTPFGSMMNIFPFGTPVAP